MSELSKKSKLLVAIRAKKSAAETEINKWKKQIAELEGEIDGLLRIADIDEIKVKIGDQRHTIYRNRQVTVASINTTAETVDALRRARLGALIGINHPKMKAWVKERMTDPKTGDFELKPQKLPPSLRKVLRVGEMTRIGVKKS